ncbi:hypothetical protein ATANTOWER_001014 [Ataeniobius toweri]|uniref:C3H1-type domain-containing protein n=1 Tax=Ataeniobius toweri TaxID=208326 RepID=A0ABU7AD94_9TELE|nr:hypothetical protein [Ataeniobius toweri]
MKFRNFFLFGPFQEVNHKFGCALSAVTRFWQDQRCLGDSRTCSLQHGDVPEFTWSIVAAGDQREERNGKSEKKTESPHGWEEGKNEGITFPPEFCF